MDFFHWVTSYLAQWKDYCVKYQVWVMQEIRLCDGNDPFQFQELAHLPIINIIYCGYKYS